MVFNVHQLGHKHNPVNRLYLGGSLHIDDELDVINDHALAASAPQTQLRLHSSGRLSISDSLDLYDSDISTGILTIAWPLRAVSSLSRTAPMWTD